MMKAPQIVAEASYNRPQDETGNSVRVVRLYANREYLYFTFELGKEPDDTITLEMPLEELMSKVGRAIAQQEVENEDS